MAVISEAFERRGGVRDVVAEAPASVLAISSQTLSERSRNSVVQDLNTHIRELRQSALGLVLTGIGTEAVAHLTTYGADAKTHLSLLGGALIWMAIDIAKEAQEKQSQLH